MTNKTAVIVGRPNVGKSTLFNKLIGKRLAITDDSPGVTRDRLYAECEWQGNKFNLIDTGGLDQGKEDIFLDEIKNQVDIAVSEADLVLFLVDGKEGMNEYDKEIALYLRKAKLPIILVINKVDVKYTPDSIYEFYSLGFDEINIISAENSYGLGDLLDKIVEMLPEGEDDRDYEDITKIAVVGKPNVGKSSLVNFLLGENRNIVTDIAGTTRDSTDSLVRFGDREYIFIDTAGLRRKRSVKENIERYSVSRTLNSIDRSELVLLMIDAEEGVSEQDSKIIGYAHDKKKAMIILINKWDKIEKDDKTLLKHEREIRERLAFVNYAPIISISVKDGLRIDKLFEEIRKVDEYYSLRISTGVLNDLISEALLINPPPTDKGRRLKIFYASQVQVRAPKFLLYVNDPDLMHFSYMRYLENQIRKKYSFTGVPLSFELKKREKVKE